MTDRDHFRDEGLGTALRELEVPEHRPEFDRELEAMLARPRRDWRLPVGAALGIAAAAALILFLVGLPSSGSDEALAAAKAKVKTALEHTSLVGGRIYYRSLDVRTRRAPTVAGSFAMSARGDLRLSLANGDSALYDASKAVERGFSRSASLGGGPLFAHERTGTAPGPPDGGPSDQFLQRQLGSALRALLVSGKAARASNTTYQGRPAWRIEFRVKPNRVYADFDRLELVIDKETGFPRRVRWTLHGAFRSDLRVEGLRVDESVPAGLFSLRFPRGHQVLRTDDGFRRVTLEEAASRVGYRPLVPDTLPQGYRPAEVAVARRSAPTASGANPPSRGVVSLSYRRGFDQLSVTTRLRDQGAHWADPFAVPGLPAAGKPVRIDTGALKGVTARVVIDPRSIPHLWAVTDKLVVTVSGDANEFELLQVARSLHPYRRSSTPPCRAADLHATAGLQGATGSFAGVIAIKNMSTKPCTVMGRPRLRLLGNGHDLHVRQVPIPPSWNGQLVPKSYPRLHVGPGDSVEARVFWSNWCGGATGPLSLSIELPGGAGRLTAPLQPGTPRCDAPRSASTIRVEPFRPTF
jgi:hypothetical protein